MSSGCVHQKASLILAGGFLLGSLVYGSGVEYSIGALLGILVGPDLDVNRGNISNTIIRNRVGRWAEIGWNVFWYSYKGSLQHGSALSHFPVVSTMFRLAYIFFFLLIVPYLGMALFIPGTTSHIGMEMGWWLGLVWKHHQIIIGLMGSDVIHYFLDVLTQEHKGKRNTMIFGIPIQSSSCK